MFTNIKKIISIGLLCIVPSQLYPMLVKTANRRPNLPHYQLKSRAHPQSRERQRNTTLRVPSKLVPLKKDAISSQFNSGVTNISCMGHNLSPARLIKAYYTFAAKVLLMGTYIEGTKALAYGATDAISKAKWELANDGLLFEWAREIAQEPDLMSTATDSGLWAGFCYLCYRTAVKTAKLPTEEIDTKLAHFKAHYAKMAKLSDAELQAEFDCLKKEGVAKWDRLKDLAKKL